MNIFDLNNQRDAFGHDWSIDHFNWLTPGTLQVLRIPPHPNQQVRETYSRHRIGRHNVSGNFPDLWAFEQEMVPNSPYLFIAIAALPHPQTVLVII